MDINIETRLLQSLSRHSILRLGHFRASQDRWLSIERKQYESLLLFAYINSYLLNFMYQHRSRSNLQGVLEKFTNYLLIHRDGSKGLQIKIVFSVVSKTVTVRALNSLNVRLDTLLLFNYISLAK